MIQTPSTDIRGQIQEALANITRGPLVDSARDFFAVLGYKSDRRIDIISNTAEGFVGQFGALNADKAITAEWRSVDYYAN
jgi:hypothetical protein